MKLFVSATPSLFFFWCLTQATWTSALTLAFLFSKTALTVDFLVRQLAFLFWKTTWTLGFLFLENYFDMGFRSATTFLFQQNCFFFLDCQLGLSFFCFWKICLNTGFRSATTWTLALLFLEKKSGFHFRIPERRCTPHLDWISSSTFKTVSF